MVLLLAAGAVAETRVVDITQLSYGADNTGAKDCTTAIRRALANANEIFLPNGNYRLDGTVTVPDGRLIYGESDESTFIKVRNKTAFIAGNENIIRDLRFIKDGNLSCGAGVVRVLGKSGVTVSNCFFDIGWKDGTGILARDAEQLNVLDCSGFETMSLLRAYGLADSTISGNVVYGWRSLLIHGMKGCKIINNTCGGYDDSRPGITGICILSQMADNTPEENSVVNNIVSNNIVQNVSEEGISLDCCGNSVAQRSQHPDKPLVHFCLKQTSSKITVDEYNGNWKKSGWPAEWADDYYLVVLTGSEKGNYAKISDSGGGASLSRGWIEFDAECPWIDNLSTNDMLLVTTGFFRNTIANNQIFNTGRTGITLHGACWNNIICDNLVEKSGNGKGCWFGMWGGIQAVSLLCETKNAVDVNNLTVAFSGFNVIARNTIDTYTASSLYTNDWAAIQVATLMGKNLEVLRRFVPQTEQFNPGNVIERNVVSNTTPILVGNSYGSKITGSTTPFYPGVKIRIRNCDYSTVTNNHKGTVLMTRSAGDIVDVGGNTGLVAD